MLTDFSQIKTTDAVTYGLIALQAIVVFVVYRRTLYPLLRQNREVASFARKLAGAKDAARAQGPQEPLLAAAWHRLVAHTDASFPHREAVEAREALASEVLLPRAYLARVDAAAPGIFTALGIVGTFLGLIIAFREVNPEQSEQSIAPLVGGMSVAFINSLVGVILSIIWALRSRWVRDVFDQSCRELVEAAERCLPQQTAGDQVLKAFDNLGKSLEAGLSSVLIELRSSRDDTRRASEALAAALSDKLDRLSTATQGLSTDLLTTLAPQLERTFKSLVDTPFENLSKTVEQYRKTVDDVAERHEEVLESLTVASAALGAAQNGLAQATEASTKCVLQFEDFVQRVSKESERVSTLVAERGEAVATALEDQTNRATALVAQSGETASALTQGVSILHSVAERQQESTAALAVTTEGLRAVSDGLDAASTAFTAAATRLEAAADKIQSIGADTAQNTARAARDELQAAVDQMADALREFGTRNVAAFESSSRAVVEAVDDRMSDLTDRLSAELNTLTVRLPEVAESMVSAAKMVRIQLDKAVRGLDDAVRQLDVASRQSLKARLEEYDGAVAKAVDHFSGTLLIWDGKVNELSGAVRRLETVVAKKSSKEREEATSTNGASKDSANGTEEARTL